MKRSREEATSNLPVLPPEIWDYIISLCSLYDFQSLKMTCCGFSEGIDKEIKKIKIDLVEFDSIEITYPYKDAHMIRGPLLYSALYQRWDRSTHSFIDALAISLLNAIEYRNIFSFRYRQDCYFIVNGHTVTDLVVRDDDRKKCYCHLLKQQQPRIMNLLKGVIKMAFISGLGCKKPLDIYRNQRVIHVINAFDRIKCHLCDTYGGHKNDTYHKKKTPLCRLDPANTSQLVSHS